MLDNKKEMVVLALGYFDSVHKGHQKVIKTARKIADEKGAKLIVCTFSGNLRAVITGENSKVVYTEQEREKLYYFLGADSVYFAPLSQEFLSLDKREYLDHLNSLYNVVAYVSGEDYRFGKMGAGTVNDVKEYALEHGQVYECVKVVNSDGKKISSTYIKRLLSEGKVELVCELLGRCYSVSGVVFADRQIGQKMGFPTINVRLDKDKERLLDGVYAGKIQLDGKSYKTIINYGARPTFNLEDKLVEAHIVDFSGELYGREVTLEFCRFVRNIIRFEDMDALKIQLKRDLEQVKGYTYD